MRMKLRIANKIIDNFDLDNPRYRDSTLARANRRWKRSKHGRQTEAWWKRLAANYKRWKQQQSASQLQAQATKEGA